MSELSIIIPVYNVEKYIVRCLESIVKQQTKDIEIILINDGSTDSSGEICQQYCERQDNFFYYQQKNQGPSVARNQGIMKATGNYILFLDSDDFLVDGILSELLYFLHTAKEDLIITKYYRYIAAEDKYTSLDVEFTKEMGRCSPIELFKIMTKKESLWPAISVVISKREFLLNNKILFKKGIFWEDALWNVQLFLNAETIKLFNKGVFCYRLGRSGSTTNSLTIKKEFDKIVVIQELDDILSKTREKDKKEILKERKAVILWSIIQELEYYRDNSEVELLIKRCTEKLRCLNYRKHVWKFYLCSMLGVGKASKVNLKVTRWIKKIFK